MAARIFSFATILFLLFLSSCGLLPGKTEEPQANMVNPAAAFCEEQGGTVEMRQDASGGQYGVCVFPDGSACDEWAFFRGECKPGDSASVPDPSTLPVYTNSAYGFSFNPPPSVGWAIEEGEHVLKFRTRNYLLWVQFSRAGEDITLLHTPDPELEWQAAGPASLLGQELPKWLLVSQGKVKQVAYGPQTAAGDLRLAIWLGYDESQPIDSAEFEMPAEVIAQADEILATFALTSGESPALTFSGR